MRCIHKKLMHCTVLLVLQNTWIRTFQFPFQTLCADNCIHYRWFFLSLFFFLFFFLAGLRVRACVWSHMPFTSIDWPIWCQISFTSNQRQIPFLFHHPQPADKTSHSYSYSLSLCVYTLSLFDFAWNELPMLNFRVVFWIVSGRQRKSVFLLHMLSIYFNK